MYLQDGLGDDVLVGTLSDDLLVGTYGCDTLIGGAGRDTLVANDLPGNTPNWKTDVLIGGKGTDIFILKNDYSTIGSFAIIADYERGEVLNLKEHPDYYSLKVEGNSTWVLDGKGNDVALLAGYTDTVTIV